jgi:hypothetical protein
MAFAGGPTRQVSEVRLGLGAGGGVDLFAAAIQQILNWLENRAGRTLPSAAWRGESFDLDDIGSQYVSAVKLEEPRRSWFARLDDADKEVAQRDWVTEIGVTEMSATDVVVGTRLSCVTRGRDVPFVASIPGFVRQLVDAFGAKLDSRVIGSEPWLVASAGEVETLVELLQGTSRSNDVIVCSLVGSNVDDSELSVRNLHLRTLGATHVVALTPAASYLLTDRLGKLFSVFDGGVRTYRAGFNLERDTPFRHPLRLRSRISVGTGGARGFEDFLVGQTISRSVSAIDATLRLMPFSAAKHAAAEYELAVQREAGVSEDALLALVEEEATAHRKALQETIELLQLAEIERDDANRQAEETRAEMHRLRLRVEGLERRLLQRGGPVDAPTPATLVGFEQWCVEYLSGQVEVLPRAFHGAKASVYENPRLVYQALLLLRDHYVPMRREGGQDRRAAYEAAARNFSLKEEASFTGPRWGEEGDEYWVSFNGKKSMLDRHLKKGDSREPRHCFRLYFFWDEDTEQAVVGWLTSHLHTRVT